MKINLAHRIGIGSAQGQQPYLDWWIEAGCRWFALNGQWAVVNKAKDVFDYEYLKAPIDRILSTQRNVILSIFSVPAHLKPEMPKVERITYDAIPYMDAEWIKRLRDYVFMIATAFPDIQTFACLTETNLKGWWRDPAIEAREDIGQKDKDVLLAERYIELVVKPISGVLKELGRKLIVGSPTMQGERQDTWDRAIRHFTTIRGKSEGAFDFLDCHIYRDIGPDTVSDIKRLFRHFEQKEKPLKNPLCISEIGFNENECFTGWQKFWRKISGAKEYTGEMKQERNYKALLEYLEQLEREYIEAKRQDPFTKEKIKHAIAYRSFDPPGITTGLNGLLKADGTPKLAAKLIREYLQT